MTLWRDVTGQTPLAATTPESTPRQEGTWPHLQAGMRCHRARRVRLGNSAMPHWVRRLMVGRCLESGSSSDKEYDVNTTCPGASPKRYCPIWRGLPRRP
jgi:hypothetical protein